MAATAGTLATTRSAATRRRSRRHEQLVDIADVHGPDQPLFELGAIALEVFGEAAVVDELEAARAVDVLGMCASSASTTVRRSSKNVRRVLSWSNVSCLHAP